MAKKQETRESTSFFENLMSAKGNISSKRFMGVCCLFVSLGCVVYLVYIEGGTQVVENLLQTVMILAAGLLGVSSVTNIWKNKNNQQNT